MSLVICTFVGGGEEGRGSLNFRGGGRVVKKRESPGGWHLWYFVTSILNQFNHQLPKSTTPVPQRSRFKSRQAWSFSSILFATCDDLRRDPFNQTFREFRSNTHWIGSVQPEKFRKNGSTFWGGPLFSVGTVGILVEWIAPLVCVHFFILQFKYMKFIYSSFQNTLYPMNIPRLTDACKRLRVRIP